MAEFLAGLWHLVFPTVVQSTPMQDPPLPEPLIPTPPLPVVQPATPKGSPTMIAQFCALIRTYEGWILPGGRDAAGNIYPNGSPAYANKNPGNIRCEGPKEDWPSLAVGCSTGGFCIFKTTDDGETTLENGVTAIALGTAPAEGAYQIAARKLGLKDCSQMTINQFFEVRDPPADNNEPDKYGSFVGKGLGVDSATFRMCQLVQ